nr:MAG TPA: hypothetical protein [Caudoviricetes sp.]
MWKIFKPFCSYYLIFNFLSNFYLSSIPKRAFHLFTFYCIVCIRNT